MLTFAVTGWNEQAPGHNCNQILAKGSPHGDRGFCDIGRPDIKFGNLADLIHW
jgi:hypothetical protein